jgi:hypothetical protein
MIQIVVTHPQRPTCPTKKVWSSLSNKRSVYMSRMMLVIQALLEVSNLIVWKEFVSVQCACCKYCRNSKFSSYWHLQMPNSPQRKQKNAEIRQNIKGSCSHKIRFNVYAMTRKIWHPYLLPRTTLKVKRKW